MSKEENNIASQVEHLFRHEYGKLVATLTKTFGVANLELAEDVVQESMIEALNKWSYSGIPDNPVGWMYQVAKRKVLNTLNREKHKREYASKAAHFLQSAWTAGPALEQIFSEKEIADDQLRMIFTCCHPALSSDSQVALTLKTLCGFSIPEIANAFLTTEDNINKRLVRARKTIKATNAPFEIPAGKDLEPRLASVLESIYLMFNEGYDASSGEQSIRFELCEEAIRLATLLIENPHTAKSNVFALLALMSLNAGRFAARSDAAGNLIDLENQNRALWNKPLIQKGLHYLSFATQQKEVSIYHLLATISAHHCTAKNFDSTDWESILKLYDMLLQLDPSPITRLNRAVVLVKTEGLPAALKELEKLENETSLQKYLPYFTCKATLYFQHNEREKAISTIKKALNLPLEKHHRDHLNQLLGKFSKKD